MTWCWFYSNETVKCPWSDSQSSFGDVVYVLFVWINQKYVITLKSNHDMDQNLLILSRKSISWHRTWTLCPHLDSRHWNHCERHTRFSIYNVNKTASLLFIHSHRDSQNMQTSNLIDFCSLIFTDTGPYRDLIYIYIYAFSRHFYPKRLAVHSGYTFVLSVCVLPGNRTHNLCAANAML